MRAISITRQLVVGDADGIAEDQATAAAGDLLINGNLATGGVATFDEQRQVIFTSGVNLALVNITITGTDDSGRVISEVLAGPNAGAVGSVLSYRTVTRIEVDDTWGVNAFSILTGTTIADTNTVTVGAQVYTFRVTVVAADDILLGASDSDSLDNLIAAINGAAGEGTLYGTGTVPSTLISAAAGTGDTMDVTSLIGGTAGNATITLSTLAVGGWTAGTLAGGLNGGTSGTSAQGASIPVPLDRYVSPFNISLGLIITGTLDATVQFTFDDIFDGSPLASPVWFNHTDMTNLIANGEAALVSPVSAVRLLTNTGNGVGRLEIQQAGIV